MNYSLVAKFKIFSKCFYDTFVTCYGVLYTAYNCSVTLNLHRFVGLILSQTFKTTLKFVLFWVKLKNGIPKLL